MKVLHICTENPARVLGGMGMHVQKLLPQLNEYCDVELLTQPLDEEGSFTYPVHLPRHQHYGPVERGQGGLHANIRAQTLKAFELCMEHDYDLIHAHDWSAIQCAFDIRHTFGIPVVTTFHLFQRQIRETEQIDSDENTTAIGYEFSGWQMSDEIIVCSQDMAFRGSDYFGQRELHVIPNGVDVSEFQQCCKREDLPRDKPIVMFLGRWTEQKGVQFILDAVEKTDEYKFVCIGPWQQNKGVHALVSERAQGLAERYPERLQLLGEMHGNSRIPYMLSADFGIVPSAAEPFGIVALEWMACGVPLITTQVDGLGEFCNDSNSIWMAQSGEGLLEALKTKVSHRMLDNAISTAERYTWRNVAWHTHTIYEEVIHEQQDKAEQSRSH